MTFDRKMIEITWSKALLLQREKKKEKHEGQEG